MLRMIPLAIKRTIFAAALIATALMLCGFLFWGNDEDDIKDAPIEPVAVEDFDIALCAIKDGYSRYNTFILIDTDRQILTGFAYISGRRNIIMQYVSTYFYDIQNENKFIYRKEPTDKDEEYLLKTTSGGETIYKKYLGGHNFYNYKEGEIDRLRKTLSEYLQGRYDADKIMTPKAK